MKEETVVKIFLHNVHNHIIYSKCPSPAETHETTVGILYHTRITQILATRCVFWVPDMQNCICGRGSAPERDPDGGAYSAPPKP